MPDQLAEKAHAIAIQLEAAGADDLNTACVALDQAEQLVLALEKRVRELVDGEDKDAA
jgi:hypothetical protein